MSIQLRGRPLAASWLWGRVGAVAVFGALRLILNGQRWRLGAGHVASYAGTRLRTV